MVFAGVQHAQRPDGFSVRPDARDQMTRVTVHRCARRYERNSQLTLEHLVPYPQDGFQVFVTGNLLNRDLHKTLPFLRIELSSPGLTMKPGECILLIAGSRTTDATLFCCRR